MMASRRTCTHLPTKVLPPGSRWEELDLDLSGVPDFTDWYVYQDCPYGNCEESMCPVCGSCRGGAGPVGCPCDLLSPLPAQRPKRHVPVKRRRGARA